MMKVFISGIGTDVGKTIVSATLAEAYLADYWKPVQSGNPDTEYYKSLISNTRTSVYPSIYSFKQPVSPHIAAAAENKKIKPEKIILPVTTNHLIVEGAGGLMVPLNENFLMIDLIQQLGLPVILVSRHYLGSINHTLLSIEYLNNQSIPLLGIIFNGNENAAVEEPIITFGKTKMLARINDEPEINREVILKYAQSFRKNDNLNVLFK
jgi:dethiobiotin synthetase